MKDWIPWLINFVFLNIESSLFFLLKKVMIQMVCKTLHLLPDIISSYYFLGLKDCSVLCKGTYTTKSTQPVKNPSHNCVGFNISFKLNETLTSKFADFRCGMQDCILDVIEFECKINRNYTGIPLNKTPSNEKKPNKSTSYKWQKWIIEHERRPTSRHIWREWVMYW